MRVRTRPDDRVAEAAQRRLEALVAELGRQPLPAAPPEPRDGAGDDPADDPADDPVDDPAGDPADDPAFRLDEDPEPDLPDSGRHARRPVPGVQRVAAWAGDRVPAPLAGFRAGSVPGPDGGRRVNGRHLSIVGVLLLAGLVLAGWSYVQATRGGGAAREVIAPRATGGVVVEGGPAAVTASPLPAAAEPSGAVSTAPPPGGPASIPTADGAAGTELVVDVEGRVRRPGIAVLPSGSRVADALEAAGGSRPGTNLRTLNLARLLVDGEQLLVGVAPAEGVAAGALSGPPAASTAPGGSPTAAVLVNLNTADQAALETLPGVGPVTATAILQWRTEHGAFTSVDELLEVSGIGDKTLAELASHVTL